MNKMFFQWGSKFYKTANILNIQEVNGVLRVVITNAPNTGASTLEEKDTPTAKQWLRNAGVI